MKLFLLAILYIHVHACFVHCFNDKDFLELTQRINIMERHMRTKDTELHKELLYNRNLINVQGKQLATQNSLLENQANIIKNQDDRIAELEQVILRTGKEDTVPKHANQGNHATSLPGNKTSKRLANGPVAFSAGLTTSQSTIGVSQNFAFDKVSLNVGSAYHSQQGMFIAPNSGIYLISCTLLSQYLAQQNVQGEIVHNGIVVARIYAHSDSGDIRFDQGSQTILVQMQAGDRIWIRNYDSISTVHGDLFTTFSGYLLWRY